MYSSAFIFEPGTYDARFHELNALIDAAARIIVTERLAEF